MFKLKFYDFKCPKCNSELTRNIGRNIDVLKCKNKLCGLEKEILYMKNKSVKQEENRYILFDSNLNKYLSDTGMTSNIDIATRFPYSIASDYFYNALTKYELIHVKYLVLDLNSNMYLTENKNISTYSKDTAFKFPYSIAYNLSTNPYKNYKLIEIIEL